jgi:ABC-type Fe3+ transport system permease subunit
LGLWLALLLNKNLAFKSFFRAVILLPFIVPTALSAIAFWWIFDSQFSIISWALVKMGWIDVYIDFLGSPWNARFSTLAANVWRGVPFVAITLLAGLQTISPSYYEASAIDGATPWQQFWHVTLPLLTPIIAVTMTFSVLFTFTDFQLIYVLTRGGPLNATHLMATLSFQVAHWVKVQPSPSPWCLSCWQPFSSVISDYNAEPGNKAAATNEQRHTRQRWHVLFGQQCQQSFQNLLTAFVIFICAAFPVLLDGHHRVQTRQ